MTRRLAIGAAALLLASAPAGWNCAAASAAGYACCKVCKAGKACGDSCIAKDSICKKGAGCACDKRAIG